MSEHSGASTLAAMTLEEPGAEQASPRAPGPFRCGPCAVWPRQQTWLCAVPLVMGFVGLGLSLMLLKWIVVGSVQDYVPTDLVDPKGSMGQDPIFLSKPSAMPKGPDISTATTSTAATVSTTTPLAADGTAPAPRTRSGPPANHTANGEGNRAPHLHNRVGTRVGGTTPTVSATRAPRMTPPPGRKEVTPRSTVRKGSGGRNGAGHSKPGLTPSTTGASATSSTTTTTTTVRITTKAPTTTSASQPVKPTARWTHGRQGKALATRPHHRFRTPMAPTQPSLRSEVFKPCVEDKDLAFCLNDGECSIIETVAGVHRHCRCKEGYHGLRCDQFVPKTDAILSDPTDELGIEFMESGDTYQRQVLSIFSIASGMCLLGVACMALYRHNKRHRQKLQAHFSESRSLRDCGINASGLMSKSAFRTQYTLHKACGTHDGAADPGASTASPRVLVRARCKGKRFRSSSLSLSPALRRKETNHFRTPPISRGKMKLRSNLADASRTSSHIYKHLREERPGHSESFRRCDASRGKVGALLGGTSHFAGRRGWTEVPCTRLDKGCCFPPSSPRARSVPIIPSLQASDLEGKRLDTQNPGGCLVAAAGPSSPSAVPISVRPQTPSVVTTARLDPQNLSSHSAKTLATRVDRRGAVEVETGQSSRSSAREQTGTGIRGFKMAGQGYAAMENSNGPSAICRGMGNLS
ncbi:pro-neuregulin-3, membrane-bound isoform [Syngnathus acus]|uniref:pro-neuregulin-3, membrane-bound isoform n=1 Tax=Syngnathus acus TaxID=161584 RepID=UPI001885D43B|nr:pro-neuregulin-3, membrane-bound isoform [Syngnathus acus]